MVNEIGQRIKRARTERGLTQTTVADKAGVHVISLSRIESGHQQPTIETLAKLAAALGCAIETLVSSSQPAA